MENILLQKKYDLEMRTFARRVRALCRKMPKTIGNIEDCKQLIRSSGSVAANYIEANESLGKRDFAMHIKICRKESKESALWLQMLDAGNDESYLFEQHKLLQESKELVLIFASILRKCGAI